jgi:hypothetical protein
MKAVLPVIAVVLGVLLLAFGLVWGNLFPPAAAWSPEQNDRLSALGLELKGIGFKLAEAQANPQMHRGENPGELKMKHDEIKKEYDALYAEFETARDSPAATGNALKWAGIVIAAVGGLFVFASRQEG